MNIYEVHLGSWKRKWDGGFYSFEELYEMSGGKDIVLVCYEIPSDFCHRHLVADWLRERGFDIEEYDFTK